MWLFSFIALLVVFPAGIIAIGVLTKAYSYQTTLVCGALFGVAVSCMILLVCWDVGMTEEESKAIANEYRWAYWACPAVGTPVLAALSALVARIGANFLVH